MRRHYFSRLLVIVPLLLAAGWVTPAVAQFRSRPGDLLRDAAAEVIRREMWHREVQRLEAEEAAINSWAAATEAELDALDSRLDDRQRMNNVLLQQYRVAGDRRRAEQLETKMQAEYRDQVARRDAFDKELRDRLDRLQARREQLQREYGIAIQQPERPGLSRQQHLTEAVKHMAEAGDHFEAVGMRRQALQLKRQLQDLERELRGDPLARPDPPELDTARLIDTLDRLNDRMERMERRLDDLRRP